MDIGISKNLLNEIIAFAEKYSLDKLLLFGSRARGDYKKTSDIDLAASGGDIVRFFLAVDEETNTLLKFDVVNLDGAVGEELRDVINKEGIVIYEKI